MDQLGSKSSSKDTDTLDIGQLLLTLWRWKLVIVLAGALGAGVGIYMTYVAAVPIYQSTATVVLESREEQVVDLEGVIGGLGSDSNVINTELEVLRSNSLLGQVVDDMGLVEDPEFNPNLRTPGRVAVAKENAKALLGLTQTAPVLPEDLRARRQREAVIKALKQKVVVRNVPASLVFEITVSSTNGFQAAQIADAIAEQYILNQIAVKFEASEQATTWLSDRVVELQVDLENAENAFKDFRGTSQLISSDTLEAMEVQLKELRNRIGELDLTYQAQQAQMAAFEAATTVEEVVAVYNDPQLTQLAQRLEERDNQQRFDLRKNTILQREKTVLTRSENQLRVLEASRSEMAAQIAAQSQDLIQLQQLEREAESNRLLYEYFLNRLKETSVQQGVQQADSRVLSSATLPVAPSSPRKTLTLLICIVLGLLLSMGLVLIREMFQNTFRTSDELQQHTGYGVIGQIPIISARRRGETLAYLRNRPTSAAAEAVRNFRTSVLMSNIDTPPQVILCSSSIPGEGKTTVSFALAQSLGGMGRKILLIEGDMRRRVFQNYSTDKEKESGHTMVDALMDDSIDPSDCVVHNDTIQADVLYAGEAPSNPADLASSQKYAALLARLREVYDHIVIDTPPVLVVPDARIMARHADTVVLIVNWDLTIKSQVVDALHEFESVDQPVSGVVLNKINPRGMKRYGYGGKYGAYATYGGKYYNN